MSLLCLLYYNIPAGIFFKMLPLIREIGNFTRKKLSTEIRQSEFRILRRNTSGKIPLPFNSGQKNAKKKLKD